MMDNKCVLCGVMLTENEKPEHILLKVLGGRVTSRRIICSNCNNTCGSTIDQKLASELYQFRHLGAFLTGDGRTAEPSETTDTQGNEIVIPVFGHPFVRTKQAIKVTDEGDGRGTMTVQAATPEHLKRLLPGMERITGLPEDVLLASLARDGRMNLSRPPTMSAKSEVGSVEGQRSMVKALLCLLRKWSMDRGIDVKIDETLPSFVLDGKDVREVNGFFTTRPIGFSAADESTFSPVATVLTVWADNFGEVIGSFRPFGLASWGYRLGRANCSREGVMILANPNDPKSYAYVPITGGRWNYVDTPHGPHPKLNEMGAAMSRIHQNGRERQQNWLIHQWVVEALRYANVREGDLFTDENLPVMSRYIADRIAATLGVATEPRPMDENMLRAIGLSGDLSGFIE